MGTMGSTANSNVNNDDSICAVNRQPASANGLQENNDLQNIVNPHQIATESIVGVATDVNGDELLSALDTCFKIVANQKLTSTTSQRGKINADQIELMLTQMMSGEKITSIPDFENPDVSPPGICQRHQRSIAIVAMLMIIAIAFASIYVISSQTSTWVLLLAATGLTLSWFCFLTLLAMVVILLCLGINPLGLLGE